MSNSDIASALDRIAPRQGTSFTQKFTFTAAASGAQAIGFHTIASDGGSPSRTIPQQALYVSLKTTAAVHVVFGDVNVVNPTNADFLLEQADGLQDFILLPDMTHFKVKGDSAGGDIYVTVTGR